MFVALSKDPQSSKNSPFRTQPVPPSKHVATWNIPFDLTVTPARFANVEIKKDKLFDVGLHSSTWFLYLEAVKDKGNTSSLARFNMHIHSMKNLKVPETASDVVNLTFELILIGDKI